MILPIHITIDGNIGAGKTTVMKYLQSETGIMIDVEPVEKWQPFLDRMYTHHEGVFEFQVRVLMDRCLYTGMRSRSLDGNAYPLIVERSPLFQGEVFVTANEKSGALTPSQCEILREMYAMPSLWRPDVYVYLRTEPAKCAERILQRSRRSEDAIPVSYLQDLHDLHEIARNTAIAAGKLVITIDAEGKTPAEIGTEILATLSFAN